MLLFFKEQKEKHPSADCIEEWKRLCVCKLMRAEAVLNYIKLGSVAFKK